MKNLPQQWKEGEGARAYFWNMPYMANQSLYDVEYFVSVVTWLSFLYDWVVFIFGVVICDFWGYNLLTN